MADVRPFRAIRYAEPRPERTAPPYDVIHPELRERLARDPHNVVHLTLAESPEAAGRRFAEWLAQGVLVEDDEEAAWAVEQRADGPDGVTRTRRGVLASVAVEPYAADTVLPHERTHAGPKQGRLRLLREARAQLEPIFLLHDGPSPVATPAREADLEVEGTRLWRVSGDGVAAFFRERTLLIADGHHRYETAVALAEEEGTLGRARIPALLVSTSDAGLGVFPTHRLAPTAPELPAGETLGLDDAVGLLEAADARAHTVAYADGVARLVHGREDELDVELVERLVGSEGLGYTPDWRDAASRVDAGAAAAALLVRPVPVAEVFARARAGRTMPQKTTYFFPKLVSGLLFARV